MVSGRRNMLNSDSEDGKTSSYRDRKGDLESGNGTRTPRRRFRDVVKGVIQDGRRDQMKKRLLEGVKTGDLEHYRKSQDEVSDISRGKVRGWASVVHVLTVPLLTAQRNQEEAHS